MHKLHNTLHYITLYYNNTRAKGKRTKEEYEKINKPDYGVLLQPSFWFLNTKTSIKARAANAKKLH